MTMIRKVVPATISSVAEDEVEVVISTAALARDGHILVPSGCILDNYRSNPIVLWQHDPEHPVGNAEEIVVGTNNIRSRIRFAPPGVTKKSDEVRGLVKAGVVRTLSVGFDPIDTEPLDPKKPRGGQRILSWELLEISFCSVPIDTGAIVTARAKEKDDMAKEWKVGAARDLPIEDSDEWDGAAAEASIFEYAGGDDFTPAKARKGFLVYDASKPKERGSYKLPIAHMVDGELKVPKGAIRAAASRLPDTDIPDDVKEKAGAVLDAYKEKAGIGDKKDGDRSKRKISQRSLFSFKPTFARGIYDVANMCYTLEQLGWQVDMAKWEAAIEGDESELPAMLGKILVEYGEALIAAAEEEVKELLEGKDLELDGDEEELVVEERAHIDAAKTPAVRNWRRALAVVKLRAGKTLSKDTVRCLRAALDDHEEAMDMHRSAMRMHKRAAGQLQDMMDRAGATDDDPEADKTVQKSDGVEEDEGSRAALSRSRRKQDLEALSAVQH